MNLRHNVPFFINYTKGHLATVSGTNALNLFKARPNSLKEVIAFGGTEQLPENYIDSVTAEGKCIQSNLPEGYIQTDYTDMLVGSYVLTDVIPQSGGRIELDFQTTTLSSQVTTYLGARSGSTAGNGIRLGHTGDKSILIYGFQDNGGYTSNIKLANNTRYKFVYDNGTATITSGSTTVDTHTFTDFSEITKELALNAYNYTTLSGNLEEIYVYSLKVFDNNGNLVLNYIPDRQDTTVGFYNNITSSQISATAGSFSAGTDIAPTPDSPMDIVCNNGIIKARHQSGLPLGYQRVGFVTNTAQTMINTGVRFDFSKNYEIELKASGVTGSWYILQSRETTSGPITGISGSSTGSQIGLNFDGTYVAASQITRVVGHIYNIKGTINNGNLTLYVKDETVGTEETVTGTYTPRIGQSADIGLFGNTAGNYVAIDSNVYFARIKEDGNYIIDYVPCRQVATAGFYDKVSNTFKTATNLSAGSTVSDPIEIYTDGTQETITDNIGNIATCQNLLAVDTYKDTQEILSGAITLNIGIKVFVGTENWQSGGNGTGVYMTLGPAGSFVAGEGFCTHSIINPNSPNIVDMNQNEFCLYSNGNMSFKNANTTSASDWKTFLSDQYAAGTPVIIVYPLSTATTETVTGQYLEKEPLTVTGSLSNLVVNAVSSSHTAPTPIHPLDINCNNGVLKARHQSGLPWGYTLLEYVESDGNQYIDPQVSGNARWVITAQTNAIKGSSQSLISSTSGASGGTWYGEFTTTRHWDIISGGTDIPPTTKTTADLTFDGNGVRGTIGSTSVDRVASVTQGTWRIFVTTGGSYPFAGKLFDAKIYQGGVLVRNFIPAKDSNDVVGLYDTVSGTFFTNGGSGAFTAGSPVNDLEIYADGTVETINAHGKNLFDKNHLPKRIYAYFANSGTTWLYISSGYSLRFPCLPNTTYTARYNGNSTQVVLSFASTSKDTVPTSEQTNVTVTQAIRQNSPTINTPITLTTGANDKWLIIQYNAVDPQNIDMTNNLQIEQGSTATTYENYYNGGQATAEMLLKVGTYQDVQSVLDGAVTRNVGIKVLDGTEDYIYSKPNTYGIANIASTITGKVDGNTNLFMCSHFVAQTTTWTLAQTEGILNGNNNNQVFFRVLGTRIPSLIAWQQYLADQYNAGTPVIIVYPLATATTETVTGQELQVTKGNNIVEITQASMNNLELEATYRRNK